MQIYEDPTMCGFMEVEMKGEAKFLAQIFKKSHAFPYKKNFKYNKNAPEKKSVALCQDILIRNIGCDKTPDCSICTCTEL